MFKYYSAKRSNSIINYVIFIFTTTITTYIVSRKKKEVYLALEDIILGKAANLRIFL